MPADNPVKVSVIIPAFNEVESLPELMDRITTVLTDYASENYDIWVIDDGSSDGTAGEMERLVTQYPSLNYVRFRRNYGKAAALMEGFRRVRGEYVITMDADLQDDPEEIPELVEMLENGTDLVSGWKKVRHDPLSKRLPSKLFNAVTRWTTGINIHDFNCGLKAYRKNVVKDLNIHGELHRYIPVMAHFLGYSIGEKVVQHHPRQYGKTKYGVARFFRGFFDFITVLFLSKYTKRPMHFFGMGGLIMTGLGLGINLYLAIYWFMGGSLSNRPLLFLAVLLVIVGVQLFSIGLLGEMLAYQERGRDKPQIREIIE
ncbi:MAG: glycosyltransferase family 2 protein [Candidatus Marinimicrobia bacterium]|nr:glycosyltransferase family 2 protein [Candidatus Neomarinimicrobiota bacterium]MCF7829826.1 glycosyltransferase family 2 protein [Candidatus Neomarinimicrobiota bacterium]MCF7881741.1 glycosyltransferase family 2 protein [Candidatus Neomarinimicrobiota bacterium]